MARIRTIKPGFFRHADLYDAEVESGLPLRIAFAGLWCCADREGRFRWQPRELKLDALPHDLVDFSRVLDALTTRGFIVRYATADGEFGAIPSWSKHQVINNREVASVLPAPPKNSERKQKDADASATRQPRVPHADLETHKGNMEGEGEYGRGKEQEEDICPEPSQAQASAPKPEALPIPEFLLRPQPQKPESPAFIALETNKDGVFYTVTEAQVAEFASLYAAVDVRQQLREMKGWLIGNKSQRKTTNGMLRFVNGWLAREQNRPKPKSAGTSRPAFNDPDQFKIINPLESMQ